MNKLLNPCGYGFDPHATSEDYQEAISRLQARLLKQAKEIRDLRQKTRKG